ncbi:MAG: hypothetical protein ACRC76_07330 [Proteocatella sp.]
MKNNKAFEIMLDSNASFFLIESDFETIEGELVSSLSRKFKIDDFYNNIDVRIFDSKELQISDIKQIVFEMGLKPFFNKKIIIFKNFEKVGELAQNAMLKSIEELPSDTIIISICNDTIGILDTIKSRAYSIYLNRELSAKESKSLRSLSTQEILKIFEDKLEKNDILEILENFMASEFILMKDAVNNNKNVKDIININTKLNKCYNYINSNCNRNLCTDLLLYRILEEK